MHSFHSFNNRQNGEFSHFSHRFSEMHLWCYSRVRNKYVTPMSFTWHTHVLQLSPDESEIGGWFDQRRWGVWRRDTDGIGLSHSRVGELTYIDLSGLCQGDECLISISCQMSDSSVDWFWNSSHSGDASPFCNGELTWPWRTSPETDIMWTLYLHLELTSAEKLLTPTETLMTNNQSEELSIDIVLSPNPSSGFCYICSFKMFRTK